MTRCDHGKALVGAKMHSRVIWNRGKVLQICSACNSYILPGQQAQATKGRNRKPVKMHRDCWAKKRSQLKDPVHLAMSAHYKASGAACVDCGSTENIQADHIVSREQGGSNAPSNYQPLCQPCNARKGKG